MTVPITRMGKTVIRPDIHARFQAIRARADAKELAGYGLDRFDNRAEERFLARAHELAAADQRGDE